MASAAGGGQGAHDEPERVNWQQSSEDWDWLIAHPEVVEPYRGEYVAIWDKRVIVHGRNPYALRDALKASRYWAEPLLVFRVPTRDEAGGTLVL
jgi:hypothetical protein